MARPLRGTIPRSGCGSDGMKIALVTDAWVGKAVEDVDDEVDQNHQAGD